MSHGDFRLRMLFRRVFGVAGGIALSQLVTGLSYVIAARTLGPATFGRYAAGVGIASTVSVVFDFGLQPFLVREIASQRVTVTAACQAIRRKRGLAWAAAAPLAAALLLVVRDSVSAAALSLMFIAMWEAGAANALLRSKERFVAGVTGQVCGRTVGLAVVFSATFLWPTESALPMGLLVGLTVEAFVDRLLLGRLGPTSGTRLRLWKMQREAVSYGFTALGSSAQQLDTPLVALGGGVISAGLYAAAGRLLGTLGVLGSSLASVSAPWLARAQIKPQDLNREERKVALVTVAIAGPPLLAAIAGPTFLPLILGSAYKSSGLAFSVLAVGAMLATLNQGAAVMLQNRRAQGWVAGSVAAGLTVGLIASFVFARAGGAVAAAWGYTVSQLIVLILIQSRLRRLRTTSNAYR